MQPTDQFKIINDSFIENTNLVFHLQQNCFYAGRSVRLLNDNIYEKNQCFVYQKVKEFIINNSHLLQGADLQTFQNRLNQRIQKIQKQTTGFWAFLIHLFNPQRKVQLNQTKTLMEEINGTVEQALCHPQVENESRIENTEEREENISQPFTPISFLNHSLLQTPPRNFSSPVPKAPASPFDSVNIPAPLLDFNTVLLTGEPQPLTFKLALNTHGKSQLPPEILREQIKEIEEYVTESEQALAPIQEKISRKEWLEEQLKEEQLGLSELQTDYNQCIANLEHLRTREDFEQVAYLKFKIRTEEYTIPYFPDKTWQEMQDKLKDENISNSKTYSNYCFKISDAISELNAFKDDFEAQCLELQNKIGMLEEELLELNQFIYDGMNLVELTRIVKAKTKKLETCKRCKNSRQQLLDHKQRENEGVTKEPCSLANSKQDFQELIAQFPDFVFLLHFPRQAEILIKFKQTHASAQDNLCFQNSLYARLSPEAGS